MTNICYRVTPIEPVAHLFEIVLTIAQPKPAGQTLRLPTWIPGSYKIRDFAKHIVCLSAQSAQTPVRVDKIDNHTWQVAPCTGPLAVTYQVYAWDLSVRTAHLDQNHGFFNASSLLLEAIDQSGVFEIILVPPAQYPHWRVATALTPQAVDVQGFGSYLAEDYDSCLDHPVEMGTFSRHDFEVNGLKHVLAITGPHHGVVSRLVTDVQTICRSIQALFGPPAIDFPAYYFLLTLDAKGFGGLEHRASTALISPRHTIPTATTGPVSSDYARLLSLCAHEYFHAWLVKRIKPAAFSPYNLQKPNLTTQLWAFEGITAYYDNLILVVSGLISPAQYWEMLSKTLQDYLETPGRLVQTLAESSLDAWIKFYQPDENSRNASISYYLKGELVALCLDIFLRQESEGRLGLDAVLQQLWQRYGREPKGISEADMMQVIASLGGPKIAAFLEKALYSTEPLPLEEAFSVVGLDIIYQSNPLEGDVWKIFKQRYGIKCQRENLSLEIQEITTASPAIAAGLAAGDHLLAIGGFKLTPENIRGLCMYEGAQPLPIVYFRGDLLYQGEITPQPLVWDKIVLQASTDPAVTSLQYQQAWLGQKD